MLRTKYIAIPFSAISLGAGSVPAISQDFYAGVFGGWSQVSHNVLDDEDLTPGVEADMRTYGGLFGWRNPNGIGVEADFSLPVESTTPECEGGAPSGGWCDFNWDGRVRGILSSDFNGGRLFAAAGGAIINLGYRHWFDGSFSNETLYGVTFGVGADIDIGANASIRIEGLSDQFMEQPISLPDGYNGRWSQNTIRAAAIFNF